MLFARELSGQLFRELAIVVAFALAASLAPAYPGPQIDSQALVWPDEPGGENAPRIPVAPEAAAGTNVGAHGVLDLSVEDGSQVPSNTIRRCAPNGSSQSLPAPSQT